MIGFITELHVETGFATRKKFLISFWQLFDILTESCQKAFDNFVMASLATGQSKSRLLWEAELTIVRKPTRSLSTRPPTVLASWLASWSRGHPKNCEKDVKKLPQTN